MKQYIIKKQLNELSDIGKIKLNEWGKEKGLWWSDNLETKTFPLLSIGQMIEFLGDEWWTYEHVAVYVSDVSAEPCECLEPPLNKKLCDALWKQVKEILEK